MKHKIILSFGDQVLVGKTPFNKLGIDYSRKILKNILGEDSSEMGIRSIVENLGATKFIGRCGDCGDSIYESSYKSKNHELKCIDGCICDSLTLDGQECDTIDKKIVYEVYREIIDELDENDILRVCVDLVSLLGEYDDNTEDYILEYE